MVDVWCEVQTVSIFNCKVFIQHLHVNVLDIFCYILYGPDLHKSSVILFSTRFSVNGSVNCLWGAVPFSLHFLFYLWIHKEITVLAKIFLICYRVSVRFPNQEPPDQSWTTGGAEDHPQQPPTFLLYVFVAATGRHVHSSLYTTYDVVVHRRPVTMAGVLNGPTAVCDVITELDTQLAVSKKHVSMNCCIVIPSVSMLYSLINHLQCNNVCILN